HSKPNKRIEGLPCVFNIQHEETVNLKEFHKGALHPSETNHLRCTYFYISHLIRETLRPHLALLDFVDPNLLHETAPPPLPVYGIHFRFQGDFISPSMPTRSTIKSIFNAQNFNKYLELHRCRFLSFLNNTKSIDWPATWNRFKNCSNLPKSHTSFKKSIHITFASKLMLDDLPLLSKLQTTRRPDLYMDNWNCFLCNDGKETWDHLWQCTVLKPRLLSLLASTKQAFETWIIDNCKFQINHIPESWNNLSVWQYPNLLSASISFDLLIRGFIPSELTRELAKYLYKKDISDAINLLVSKAIDIFHEDIWAHRCRLFAEKELALGIDQSSKTSRAIP